MLVFKGEGQNKCLEFTLGSVVQQRLTCIHGCIMDTGKTPLTIGRNVLGTKSNAQRGSIHLISVLTAA